MDPSGMKTCCGICKKAINRNQTCIHCVDCQQWVHATCNNLHRKDLMKMNRLTFICAACMKGRKNETSGKRKNGVKQNELKKLEGNDDKIPNNNENVTDTNIKEKLGGNDDKIPDNNENVTDTNIKEESGSDSEFEEFDDYAKYSGEISEFELTRLENIKRNREMFEKCNIKGEMSVKKRHKKKKDSVSLPSRKSLRVQNLPIEPIKLDIAHVNTIHGWGEQKPKEMEMKCINEVEDGFYGSIVKSWLKDDAKTDPGLHSDHTSDDMTKYKEKITSLSVSDISKVTEKRGFSIAWYPSKTKKVICLGNTKGSIGIWDIDISKEKDSIFLFDVHSGPVSCLTFSPFDKSKMYSCSYDGTLTCGDLNQLNFSQEYSDENYRSSLYHFSFPYQQRNTLLLSNGRGEVLILDQSAGKIVQKLDAKLGNPHIKYAARCVDCHPLNENLIVTSLGDGTLASWDLRYIDIIGAKNCLSSFKAAKAIDTSFFSPSGNKILMTSQDHYLRVFDVNETGVFKLPPKYQINHENRKPESLSATWDPKTDSSFVCGSLANPRQINLFACDEKEGQLLSYTLCDERLVCITELNVFHPERDLIASANSFGKVLVWS